MLGYLTCIAMYVTGRLCWEQVKVVCALQKT